MLNSVKLMSGACLLAALIAAPAMAQSVSPPTSSTQSCLRFEDVLKLSALRDPSVTISKAQEFEADAEIKDAKLSNQIGVRASQRVFDFGDSKYARQAATSGFQASLEDTRQAKLQAAKPRSKLNSQNAAAIISRSNYLR